MNLTAHKFLAIGASALLAAGLLSGLSSPAQAQAVYRIVGPDGKVTFSDKPPVTAAETKAVPAAGGGANTSGTLPYELRQVVGKYPVTLYTGDNCSPCTPARSMLMSRGIPFTERTINTNEDIQALQRLSGETSLPFATIGSQQLKGYSDSEWTQFLDAAGYPKSSMLPASFRRAPATPLVAVSAAPATSAATPAAATSRAAARRPVTPPPPAADNPAGIKF